MTIRLSIYYITFVTFEIKFAGLTLLSLLHINLIPEASLLTGEQIKGVRAKEILGGLVSKVLIALSLVLVVRSKGRNR